MTNNTNVNMDGVTSSDELNQEYGLIQTQTYSTSLGIKWDNTLNSGMDYYDSSDHKVSTMGSGSNLPNSFVTTNNINYLGIQSTNLQNNRFGTEIQHYTADGSDYTLNNDPSDSTKYIRGISTDGSEANNQSIISFIPTTDSNGNYNYTDSLTDYGITAPETFVANESVANISNTNGFTAYNTLYLISNSGMSYKITLPLSTSSQEYTISWTEQTPVDTYEKNSDGSIIPQYITASDEIQFEKSNNSTPIHSGTISINNNQYQWLNTADTYSSGLQTVTISINNTVQALIDELKNENILSSIDSSVSDWYLIGVGSGISSTGNGASGTLYVENSDVYKNTNDSTTNTIQNITTATTTTDDTRTLLTTSQNSNNTITTNSTTDQTIVSNGNDTINIASANNVISTINGTTTINGSTGNGTLTASLNTSSTTTITGNYNNIYVSPIDNTSTSITSDSSFGLTGYGSFTNINNINIVGYDANLSIENGTTDTVVGTYKNLVLNNNSSETAYASVSTNGYINSTSSTNNINLTATGDLSLYGNAGTTNIWGNNAQTLTIYGTSTNHISGNWTTINGIVENNTNINVSTDNANIYNNNGDITLTGNSDGDLTFNGTGTTNIVGTWGAVNATIGTNQTIHSSIGNDSYITVTTGGNANLWNRTGTENAVDQEGGTLDITMGSGYTGLSINMNSNSITNITNFQGKNGQIILNGLTSDNLNISYNTSTNTTNITSTGVNGNITLSGTTHINTLSLDQGNNHSIMLIPN